MYLVARFSRGVPPVDESTSGTLQSCFGLYQLRRQIRQRSGATVRSAAEHHTCSALDYKEGILSTMVFFWVDISGFFDTFEKPCRTDEIATRSELPFPVPKETVDST